MKRLRACIERPLDVLFGVGGNVADSSFIACSVIVRIVLHALHRLLFVFFVSLAVFRSPLTDELKQLPYAGRCETQASCQLSFGTHYSLAFGCFGRLMNDFETSGNFLAQRAGTCRACEK
jgi:hypothetical protein